MWYIWINGLRRSPYRRKSIAIVIIIIIKIKKNIAEWTNSKVSIINSILYVPYTNSIDYYLFILYWILHFCDSSHWSNRYMDIFFTYCGSVTLPMPVCRIEQWNVYFKNHSLIRSSNINVLEKSVIFRFIWTFKKLK